MADTSQPSQTDSQGASSSGEAGVRDEERQQTVGQVFEVYIVAADRPIWSGQAHSVTIPASEGGMGILPNHEPVMTVIKRGTVSVTDPQGRRLAFDVADGFIAFDSNKLTVAVDHASRSDVEDETVRAAA